MMIKITTRCSMGCSHCMNDAKPDGQDMTMDTFRSVLQFQQTYGGPYCILTGGEPTEHPDFEDMVRYAAKIEVQHPFHMPLLLTITTNGRWMETHYDFVAWTLEQGLLNEPGSESTSRIMWQVSSIPPYYPYEIDTTLPVFSLPNVLVIRELVGMYPQGRARQNHFPYDIKASKCYNVRAITRQLLLRDELDDGLRSIFSTMASYQKMCTPHIDVNGAIKVGESDLCPVCSHHSKPEQEIIEDILKFNCHGCDFINDKLPELNKALLGINFKKINLSKGASQNGSA